MFLITSPVLPSRPPPFYPDPNVLPFKNPCFTLVSRTMNQNAIV